MLDKIGTWLLSQGWPGLVVLACFYVVYQMWTERRDDRAASQARDDAHLAQLLATRKEAQDLVTAERARADERAKIDQARVDAINERRIADANAKADEMRNLAASTQGTVASLVAAMKEP